LKSEDAHKYRNAAFHLRRTAVPEPGDLRSVLDLCGVQAAEDFDETRPLWQIHLVEGLAADRAAIVVKVSHSLTDGIGGSQLLRLFGDEPPTPNTVGRPSGRPPTKVAFRDLETAANVDARDGAENEVDTD